MAGRAELLRSHAFEMAGLAVPPHAVPPAPVITIKDLGAICWSGSAGAVKYTIERQDSASAPWVVLTDSATDADTPWVDPNPVAGGLSGMYRVTAYNADGLASQPFGTTLGLKDAAAPAAAAEVRKSPKPPGSPASSMPPARRPPRGGR